ncbi:major facilitator superfamily domain-containing protein [Coniochaeta sp. 2T2.1]|nr:major facilitator superfamily domain-containing protein [Coniochaeta sp. 2T2.1]
MKSSAPAQLDVSHIESLQADDYDGRVQPKAIVVVMAINFIYFAHIVNVVGAGALATNIVSVIGGSGSTVWFASAITIATVVLCPPVSQAADYWGRKWLLVVLTVCGGVGAIIVSRAESIGVAIAGFTIGGISYGAQSILYAVVSEVLPRKYRSWAQASVQVTGSAGGVVGLLVGGALVVAHPTSGFRTYFYIDAGIYFLAAIICAMFYNPPLRELQRLNLREKLRALDWVGYALLTIGLVLFCIGLSWSQNPYSWRDAHVLAPFVVGVLGAIAFIAYEYFKKDGMVHRKLFQDRNFAIALGCLFVEGLVFFSVNNYFAFEVIILFQKDAFQAGLHFSMVFFALVVSSLLSGVYVAHQKSIRFPAVVAATLFLAFYIAMATVNTSTPIRNLWAYPILIGLGLGMYIVVLVTAAQFAAPPELISTSSGLTTSVRSLGGTIGLAINNAIVNSALSAHLGPKVAGATLPLGLPASSLGDLIPGLLAGDPAALAAVPGVTPEILGAGGLAVRETFVIAFRNVWIAAAAFIVVALVASLFLRDHKDDFSCHIDAPIQVPTRTEVVEKQIVSL